jgi:ribosome biogenesis protein SSF1/2
MDDVLKSAAAFGVTHLILFKQTDTGTNVRFARLPHGPTLHFRVDSFALVADLIAAQPRPRSPGLEFKTPPLVRPPADRPTECVCV